MIDSPLTNRREKRCPSSNPQKSFTIIISLSEPAPAAIQLPAQPVLNLTLSSVATRKLKAAANSTAASGAGERKIKIVAKDKAPTTARLSAQASDGMQLIDRFVATESEILPALANDTNKAWTRRFSRGLKSELEYRFR